MTRPISFEDFLTIQKAGPDRYISKWPTECNRIASDDKIGYGGCTIAFAIVVGYATVKETHNLYSCLGVFLAPAYVDEKLQAKITVIRDSRSFSTRFLEIQQRQGTGLRTIATVHLDFQIPEKHSMLGYSPKPKVEYSSPQTSWDEAKVRQYANEHGVPEFRLKQTDVGRQAEKRYFDIRFPPESFGARTLHGMAPELNNAQKGLGVMEKTNATYWKLLVPSESKAIHAAAIAFALDAGIPFTPLSFAALHSTEIASFSSLDFAIRFTSNNLDANAWLLRDEQTVAAGEGRTFGEARMWNLAGDLVAIISEQCLLRPKVDMKEKL